MAPPFAQAALTVEIPVVKDYTFYTRCGDFLPLCFTVAAVFLLLFGAAAYIIKKYCEADRCIKRISDKRR
jgi:apolipoprotein N-acyltransferase